MTSINSQDKMRFYQFLNLNQDWANTADTNCNGAVEKDEFTDFLKNSGFDFEALSGFNGSNEDDLITKFFNSFNTNKTGYVMQDVVDENGDTVVKKNGKNKQDYVLDDNGKKVKEKKALNEDEIAAMNAKVAIYGQVLEEVEGFNNRPSNVDSEAWTEAVTNALMSIVGNKTQNIDSIIDANLEKIAARITAQMYIETYATEKFDEYSNKYNYDYKSDRTLQSMLSNLVKKAEQQKLSPEEIEQEVEALINNYLATANPSETCEFDFEGARGKVINMSDDGEENDPAVTSGDVAESVWIKTTRMNPLQKTILEQTLKSAMDSGKSTLPNYDKFGKIYDKAIADFIEDLMKNTKVEDFDAVMSYDIESFKDTTINKKYADLAKEIELRSELIKDTGKFYTKLSSTLKGDTIANKLINLMDGENKEYDKIVNQAVQNYIRGDFESVEAAIDYVVKEIKNHLGDIMTSGLKDMTFEELGAYYDNIVENAKANNDFTAIKEAAISYCDTIVGRTNKSTSSALVRAVYDQFGENYKSEIAKLTANEVMTKMEALKEAIKALGDPTELKINEDKMFAEIANGVSLMVGSTREFKITPAFNGKDGNEKQITSDRVEIKPNNPDLFNYDPATGTLTVTGKQLGNYTAGLDIYVDGVKVATKTVNVNIKATLSDEDKAGIKTALENGDGGFAVRGTYYDFKSLLGDELRTHSVDVDRLDNVVSYITDFTGEVANILKAQFPEYADSIDRAVKTTINYYTAVVNVCSAGLTDDDEGVVGNQFTYYDENLKKEVTCNDKYARSWAYPGNEGNVNSITKVYNRTGDSSTGIYRSWSQANTWYDHHDYCYIDLRVVLEKMLQFM